MTDSKRFFYQLSVISCLLSAFLSGCATVYTTEQAAKKYNNGYVVKRNGVIIPEFTIDSQGKAPADKKVAQNRFVRRRHKILRYYRQMGYFGSAVSENAKMFSSAVGAPFIAPFEGRKYLRYERDPVYRAQVNAQDELEEKKLQERINAIVKEMKLYIDQDMAFE